METIISLGWGAFIALVAILGLGVIFFGAALAAFVMTPVGLVITAGLAAFGGVSSLKTLYKNRVLPIAVKETGVMYQKSFESHINDFAYIDSLVVQASQTLLSKATKLIG